jgi:hypothetical protein
MQTLAPSAIATTVRCANPQARRHSSDDASRIDAGATIFFRPARACRWRRRLWRRRCLELADGIRLFYSSFTHSIQHSKVLGLNGSSSHGSRGSNTALLVTGEVELARNDNLARVSDLLPDDPGHILMPTWRRGRLDLFKVDVYDGSVERIGAGRSTTVFWFADRDGVPAFRADTNWGRTVAYVYARKGAGDLKAVKTNPAFDIDGVLVDLHTREYVGAWYYADRQAVEYADPALQAEMNGLNAYFNNEVDVYVEDHDRAGSTLLLYATGPRDRGSFHVYRRDRKYVREIAPAQPKIAMERLGPMQVKRYKAHDGLEGKRQWGGAMQNDLTDGVDFLIQEGLVDRGRACIIGASGEDSHPPDTRQQRRRRSHRAIGGDEYGVAGRRQERRVRPPRKRRSRGKGRGGSEKGIRGCVGFRFQIPARRQSGSPRQSDDRSRARKLCARRASLANFSSHPSRAAARAQSTARETGIVDSFRYKVPVSTKCASNPLGRRGGLSICKMIVEAAHQ